MEIRLHGRGGQGGVTCAKILAALYARMGKSVQAFGDYAGERSGAPVRAYTRVADDPIVNRNKVYNPDHLLVLDPTLLTDETVQGLVKGGTLLLNTADAPESLRERFPDFRVVTVDATRIAREHRIGTRSVVIVNTTIAGAYVAAMDLPLDVLEKAYGDLGLGEGNVDAARCAYSAVQVAEPLDQVAREKSADVSAPAKVSIGELVDQVEGKPTPLKTGSWRSQVPSYVTRAAPCQAACPAGNDVVGFVQAVHRDDLDEAAQILAATSPLPGVCGRVCPGFCMDACNRRHRDGSVNVRGLERWIGDHAHAVRLEPAPAADAKHIAVVGSGPAGLSAAFHLALSGHQVTLFDQEEELGGVLRTGIPTYRLPRDVLDREVERILALGVNTRTGVKLTGEALEGLANEMDAVILATGLQSLRRLDATGAALSGVEQGIDFLSRANRGGETLAGHVVVLGGGNTALDCARTALRVGAERVTIAYRRTREEMPAIAEEVEEALEEGISLLIQRAPVGFTGNGKVSAVELAEVEMGQPDDSGRRRPVVTDRRQSLDCEHVLLALGQSAEWSLLPKEWRAKDGRLWNGEKELNVFAAGDVATSEGTVTHAIGHGRHTAMEVLRALGIDAPKFERPQLVAAVDQEVLRFEHFEAGAPNAIEAREAGARVGDFGEVNQGLADASEAARCFSCGQCTHCDTCLVYCPDGVIRRTNDGYDIDLEYCKGCGICVAECPRGAMEMNPQ